MGVVNRHERVYIRCDDFWCCTAPLPWRPVLLTCPHVSASGDLCLLPRRRRIASTSYLTYKQAPTRRGYCSRLTSCSANSWNLIRPSTLVKKSARLAFPSTLTRRVIRRSRSSCTHDSLRSMYFIRPVFPKLLAKPIAADASICTSNGRGKLFPISSDTLAT